VLNNIPDTGMINLLKLNMVKGKLFDSKPYARMTHSIDAAHMLIW
jgi:hypothetical protein